MKYTILGFNQSKLIEFKMDIVDALIIRYFVDFKDCGDMITRIIDGDLFYWLKYSKLLEEIPIIKIKSKDVLRRRLKSMVENGILKSKCVRQKGEGTFSFYALGTNYKYLIKKSEGTTKKSEGYDPKVDKGTTKKSEGYDPKVAPKDSSIKDTSIKDTSIKDSSTKERENKDTHSHALELIKLIEELTSSVGTISLSAIKLEVEKHGYEYTKLAVEKAITNNKCKISYINGILQNWAKEGYPSLEDINKPKKINKNSYSNKKPSSFCDYEQRSYDLESIENKLLGWE